MGKDKKDPREVVLGEPASEAAYVYDLVRMDNPQADLDVEIAQRFIRESEPRIGNVGDPDKALTEEQLGWSVEDSQYRLRLIEESGGSESAFEGIVISEETDPAVQGMVIAFKARQMAEDGVRALEAYQASWEIRLGHRIYQWRLRVTERLQEFYAWLRRTE